LYVILVYDVAQKRVQRVFKYCGRFLTWVQNSVFEGEVTQSQLARIERGISRIIEPDYDSVLIYVLRDNNWLDRRSLGARKGEPTNLI